MRHYMLRARQRGAALVVGLVLLMVLTILAVSTMRTATLGLTLAANAQYRENAFQLSQSGLDATLRQVAANPAALDQNPACAAALGAPVRMDQLAGQYQTRVCYQGFGYGLGDSEGKIGRYNYEVTSRGQTDQRGAVSQQAQGFYVEGNK